MICGDTFGVILSIAQQLDHIGFKPDAEQGGQATTPFA